MRVIMASNFFRSGLSAASIAAAMKFPKSKEFTADGTGAWLTTVGAVAGSVDGAAARTGIREAAVVPLPPSFNRGFDVPILAGPRSAITAPTQNVDAWISFSHELFANIGKC